MPRERLILCSKQTGSMLGSHKYALKGERDMKRSLLASVSLLLLLAGCTPGPGNQMMEPGQGPKGPDSPTRGMGGMGGHMNQGNAWPLQASEGSRELTIPEVLERGQNADFDYEVVAKEGTTEFYEGTLTETYGYNGDLLGPTIRLKEGETVRVKVRNELDEPTTFHWHGLEVNGAADGGPHNPVSPGESQIVTLNVDQPAATLWYHPHPHGQTAEQVFKGLSGLLYVDGTEQKELGLPQRYGVDDIPLIFQDRMFDQNRQLNYDVLMNNDGTTGDVSLVNGTLDPELTVTQPQMRFRILNGSNARTYTFRLSNGASFTQIASDGGMLREPVDREELTLAASERAEILVDFSGTEAGEELALTDAEGTALLPFKLAFDKEEKQPDLKQGTAGQPFLTEEEKALPVSKRLELFGMMEMVTINGQKFDPDRIDLRQRKGVTEVWEVYNQPDMMGGMAHPFHIHGTQFKIISRDGKEPGPHEQGLKDSVQVEPGERVKLLVTFPETGIFMYHCHILEHEENGMMGQVEVY